MKRVTYEQKECGDILLVANPAIEISKLIIAAERELVPGLDFYPSHVAIYDGADWVEAWLDLKENSVAAVNPGSKYDDSAYQREVWRPEGTPKGVALPAPKTGEGFGEYTVEAAILSALGLPRNFLTA